MKKTRKVELVGELTDKLETVSWVGADGISRKGRVPTIYFVREHALELLD